MNNREYYLNILCYMSVLVFQNFNSVQNILFFGQSGQEGAEPPMDAALLCGQGFDSPRFHQIKTQPSGCVFIILTATIKYLLWSQLYEYIDSSILTGATSVLLTACVIFST